MRMERTHIPINFLLKEGGEVRLSLTSDTSIDRMIVENLMHLYEVGFNLSGICIGEPGVFISQAALETIVTLSEEQATGWISVLRRAANNSD